VKYLIFFIILLLIILSLVKQCYLCVGLGIGTYTILHIIENNEKARKFIDKIF